MRCIKFLYLQADCIIIKPVSLGFANIYNQVITLLFWKSKMNKTKLVKAIADATGLTQKLATDVLDAFMESITTTLKAGDKVTLVGFGTFSVAERAARTGRNPKTGEELKIAASKAPKFSAGATLKAAVIPPAKGKKAKK